MELATGLDETKEEDHHFVSFELGGYGKGSGGLRRLSAVPLGAAPLGDVLRGLNHACRESSIFMSALERPEETRVHAEPNRAQIVGVNKGGLLLSRGVGEVSAL